MFAPRSKADPLLEVVRRRLDEERPQLREKGPLG